jgi:hypothetical protein
VLVILDAIQFEQVEGDLVVDELPVRGVLDTERGQRGFAAEALAPLRIDAALFRPVFGSA